MMTLERRLQLLKADNKAKGHDQALDIADVIDSVYDWIDDVDNHDEHSWAANLQDQLR